MRFFGSYTNIRLRRSRNCLLKSVCPGIVSCTCQSAQAVVTGNTYVKLLHRLDVLLRGLVDIVVRVVKLVVLEVSCGTVVISIINLDGSCVDLRVGRVARVRAVLLVDRSDDVSINLATAHSLHHSQMFEVVVCLEQGIAGEEFDQDAPYTPNVAGETPAQVQDDLWRTVVSCRDNRRVVLIIEGR